MAARIKAECGMKKMDQRANEVLLQQRIKELECEVSGLKRRLEELRKAKNTTILKREREILEIGTPFGKRESNGTDDKELSRRLSEKDSQWQKEMAVVKAKHDAEINELKNNADKMAARIKAECGMKKMDQRANEVLLQQRIKELECEVSGLKRRLDELRKAKNTTILKREREILEIGTPFGKRESNGTDDKELSRRLSEKDSQWQKEMAVVKAKHDAEINELKNNADKETDCGHLTVIEFLRHRNEELENDNVAMATQNRELKERVDMLLSDLSVKEAGWCEKEDNFQLELKRSWDQKYKEWMAQMEAKVMSLQRTNSLLQTYLKNHRPNGEDPTGQGPDFDSL